MFLQLDQNGPRYQQLARAFKQAVLDGRCPAGSRLPATRVLAQELDFSRNTVLAAYELLADEGFIETRTGSGCYVAHFRAGTGQPQPNPGRSVKHRARDLSPHGRRALNLYTGTIPGRQHRGLRFDLQYGQPATNPQLSSAWRRELGHAAARARTDYPDPQGLPELRRQVCAYLARRRGITADADDVLIVSGTQQAFALAADVLVGNDDRVVFENPHYQGARQAFQSRGARIVPVAVDADGLRTQDLPCGKTMRMAVVTPSHQFPTGATLSLARRMHLLDWAARNGCWLIEDDYDGEFRYDARPLAALKSLDGNDRVIYIGTFSKVLFPALRLGYMLLPPALRHAFVAAKWLNDRGCPTIEQDALARLIGSGSFERHLRRTARALKARRAALLDALRQYAGNRVEIADSNAGMHVVAWLPAFTTRQVEVLVERARRRGVGLYTITPYCLGSVHYSGLLLGYADLPPADLRAAVRILAACLDEIVVDSGYKHRRGLHSRRVDPNSSPTGFAYSRKLR